MNDAQINEIVKKVYDSHDNNEDNFSRATPYDFVKAGAEAQSKVPGSATLPVPPVPKVLKESDAK